MPQKGRNSVDTDGVETSGVLIVGRLYTINDFNAGDDFSNVGAVNNSGSSFIATGSTPTNWTNGSVVSNTASRSSVFKTYFNTAAPPAAIMWPIILDGPTGVDAPGRLGIEASDPLQIGGFSFSLDGLMAFID